MLRILIAGGVWLMLLCRPLLALDAGFGEVDITPKVGADEEPVWMAGYGQGRMAEGVHDPIMARCVVLIDGDRRIAMVSVDLVGMQLRDVRKVRSALPEFDHVMVCSTHNHEGPDVIGIWGRTPFHRGVNDAYVDGVVVKRVVAMVKDAAARAEVVTAAYGTATDENLLNDSRLPRVFDPVLRVLDFRKEGGVERAGIVVQWNCHPEALGSENRLLTADFVASTVSALKEKYGCPVAYFTGTVGGLLAPPSGRLKNGAGELMRNGQFEFAEVYGKAVAGLAETALAQTEPIELTPISVKTTDLVLPTANMFYRIARAAGVLSRDAWVWQDDPWTKGPELTKETASEIMAIDTEVGCVRLGSLSIACIPGEIYPELVYGEFQEPADAGADYPDAGLEMSVAMLMPTEKWMLFGLANDEIGYLIPKRQWDARKPYAYGRDASQYGEVNSCGPESARLVMEALARCCR